MNAPKIRRVSAKPSPVLGVHREDQGGVGEGRDHLALLIQQREQILDVPALVTAMGPVYRRLRRRTQALEHRRDRGLRTQLDLAKGDARSRGKVPEQLAEVALRDSIVGVYTDEHKPISELERHLQAGPLGAVRAAVEPRSPGLDVVSQEQTFAT